MRNQPNIEVPASKWERFFHMLALLLFVGLIVYVAMSYHRLPDQIPLHFNGKGEVDNWGNRATILALPLIAIPTFIICYCLGKFPQVHNYPVKVNEVNAAQLYRQSRFMLALVNFEMMAIFFLVVWEIVRTSKGIPGLGEWLGVLVIVPTLLTVLYFIISMRRLKP